MDLQKLLRQYRTGRLAEDALLRKLRDLPYRDLGFARVDHHRTVRTGFPEVIFCERKTPAQVAAIAAEILRHGSNLLATRATEEIYRRVRRVHPKARWHEAARCITAGAPEQRGLVAIVTAGTSDIPVAEEARVTAEMSGARVRVIHDVGVAGIHRVLACRGDLQGADAVIVVAGMEGALPSVVAGLVSRPVIAVPTSVGYGASFKGLAALLTMLNSCAAGVVVVNIDNGFGAGRAAAMMVATSTTPRTSPSANGRAGRGGNS